MAKLGKWIQGTGEIPAGGDAYIVHRVMVAGEKPVLIQAGTWFGGDGGEYLGLAMIQPNATGIGAKELQEYTQATGPSASTGIPIFAGNLEGGITAQAAQPMFGGYIRQQMGTAYYLPPHCTIVCYASAANTAAWNVTLGGFECEDY